MRPDLAPKHVEHIKTLAREGLYDGVVFHRVIDGFMAQTGDVKHGNADKGDVSRAGTGGSDYPNLQQEVSRAPHVRGVGSMGRAPSPDSPKPPFFFLFGDA